MQWLARYSIDLTRISLGIVFLWFGMIKFFPGISPMETLATKTIYVLTLDLVPPVVSRPLLAALETIIGLGLLSRKFLRLTLGLLLFQMMGTLTPIFLFPHEIFLRAPFLPALEGHYIIKNIVFIAAGLVVAATTRGGGLVVDRASVREPARPILENDRRAGDTSHPALESDAVPLARWRRLVQACANDLRGSIDSRREASAA
jgi:hypothetical protein